VTRFPFLAQRLFNAPLAILPAKAELIAAALAERIGIIRLNRADGSAIPLGAGAYDFEPGRAEEPEDYGYDRVGGIAVIPVRGTLVQRTGTLRPWSGMCGYDGLRQSLAMALDDPEIDAVVLDIDSPGGEVAGCFDLVDLIYAARAVKPVRAILAENAFSAAYAIASAASRVSVPRTGGTGSIGILAMHVDWSRALAEAGITVTLITYGARKAEGSEFAPLGDAARARFQADIDELGELFVDTVARNRGLASGAVRDFEAGTFLGAAGVAAGLADQVASPDQAFAALLAELGG
jgi:signal peptide peptidase SppA